MNPTKIDASYLGEHPLPKPSDGGKEHRGKILVIGGSRELPGAVVLAGTAAMRAGAGILQVATSKSIAMGCGFAMPEALVMALDETSDGGLIGSDRLWALIRSSDAVVFGPGFLDGEAARSLLGQIIALDTEATIVVDAEPLKHLRHFDDDLKRAKGRVIVTPHAGEMAAMLTWDRRQVEADPVAAGERAAQMLGASVVMKGACTHIIDPNGQTWLYDGGSIGLATSGSGDVLAGVIGGLAARGTEPIEAAIWGVYLHGEAGRQIENRIGQIGLLARELSSEIPALMAGFR